MLMSLAHINTLALLATPLLESLFEGVCSAVSNISHLIRYTQEDCAINT
jgi:hypothetical protein